MRKGRRGIIVGGMVLGLLLGCNNGGEDPQKVFLKSVVILGNNFLDVFTSFGEMVGGVLGFSEKTTKSEVGNYFKKIKETVEGTKDKLNKVIADMKNENNPNAFKTADAVKTLNEKLDTIIGGASEALKGADDDALIGNVAEHSGGAGAGAASEAVKFLSEGIKSIVDIVFQGKGDAEVGNDKGPVKDADGTVGGARGDAGAGTDGDARKLFANDNAGAAADAAKAAKDAVKAVSSVTGTAILQAIAKGDNGESAKLAKYNGSISRNNGANANNAKDAIIAGGIALRAMAKNGKFANASGSAAGVKDNVINAAVSAVTKALDTLTIAIRKTIDEGLKSVKDAMKINPNDTPITSEIGGGAK